MRRDAGARWVVLQADLFRGPGFCGGDQGNEPGRKGSVGGFVYAEGFVAKFVAIVEGAAA